MLHVLGIRHHGPGSAKSLQKAIRAIEPDCILVEMPADAATALQFMKGNQLTPPVALLLYDPKELQDASYYPFARFSPEWQACRYALENSIPLVPMDLPVGIHIARRREREQQPHLAFKKRSSDQQKITLDPLGYMASLGGYPDGERWWELHFEQPEHEGNIFDTVLELVTTLRNGIGRQETEETLIREAYMRKTIRKAIKDGYRDIVVVCGAWHAPVLHNWQTFTAKTDNARLRGLKKVKTSASWVPWSFDRLATSNGYGAGVISPAWYELLFGNRKEVVIRWMTKAAHLLREEDLDVSPAHVLEAVRLSESLAALRDREIPGIGEMQEAAIAVFCKGDEMLMTLIQQKLVIGENVGRVGDDVPQIPLIKDLEKQVRSARLTKEWQSSTTIQKDLDLRKPSNLAASHLIRRLLILEIPWGTLRKGSQFKTGSFSEHWTLRKRTDYEIRLIAGGMWGNSIREAAKTYSIHKARESGDLAVVTALTDDVLKAELPEAVPALLLKLQDLAALTNDIARLMAAVPQFVNIIRYGNTRKTDADAVENILDKIIPRICIGLTNACVQLDEELAQTRFEQMASIHQAMTILQKPVHFENWMSTLQSMHQNEAIHPLIRGFVTRLLFDRRYLALEGAAQGISLALSPARTDATKASWLEGFLSGSGLLLIHNRELWSIIDEWVGSLTLPKFYQVLPLLRRTFASFSQVERKKLLEMAQGRTAKEDLPGLPEFELSEDEGIVKTVKLILGI